LVCDSGLDQHLGNLGHVIRQNYPVAIGSKLKGDAQELLNIVAPLHTLLDVFADKVMLAKSSMGAYNQVTMALQPAQRTSLVDLK